MPLLEALVPPPDKFQLEGRRDAPKTVMGRYRKAVELVRAETEQAGLHDLTAYLRLVNEGKISSDYSSGRRPLRYQTYRGEFVAGGFLALPEKYRPTKPSAFWPGCVRSRSG